MRALCGLPWPGGRDGVRVVPEFRNGVMAYIRFARDLAVRHVARRRRILRSNNALVSRSSCVPVALRTVPPIRSPQLKCENG
jgi:hypothetical protein